MIHKHSENGTVEFSVEHEGADCPYLVGSWDEWSLPGIPMVRQQADSPTWKAIVPLPVGGHQFRYRIGWHWFNDSSADFYVDNGLGGENSVVIVEEPPKKGRRRPGSRPAATKGRRPARSI